MKSKKSSKSSNRQRKKKKSVHFAVGDYTELKTIVCLMAIKPKHTIFNIAHRSFSSVDCWQPGKTDQKLFEIRLPVDWNISLEIIQFTGENFFNKFLAP